MKRLITTLAASVALALGGAVVAAPASAAPDNWDWRRTATTAPQNWDWQRSLHAAVPRAVAVVQPSPNTVGPAELKDNGVSLYDLADQAVWGVHIKDGTIPKSKIGWDFQQEINRMDVNKADAISSSNQIKPGAVDKTDLSPEVQQELAIGSTSILNFGPKTITLCGGTFATNATKLGSFDLTPGKWKMDMSHFSYRTVQGAPGTRPQLALRSGINLTPYGTVMGTELSPTKDRELTGSSFKWVLVSAPVSIDVYGFCYNDDQSAAGGGEFTMSAQVALMRG